MTFFKTCDGRFGWRKNKDAPVRWFNTEFSAMMYGVTTLTHNDMEEKQFMKDFKFAMVNMINRGHNEAEFGIFGSFMWSKVNEN